MEFKVVNSDDWGKKESSVNITRMEFKVCKKI